MRVLWCVFCRLLRCVCLFFFFFFFSSRRRHTRSLCDWSSDVCSSDLCQADCARRSAGIAGRRLALTEAKRSEEHTSELQSHSDLVCHLLLDKKRKKEYDCDNHDQI